MKRIVLLLGLVSTVAYCYARDYLVGDYGNVGDTTVLSSPAINAAIADCNANGGGRVIVPTGKYRCGTIFLKSHVELHLEIGAVLFASDDDSDFPMQPRNHYRSQKDAAGWNAFIFAYDAEDIALTGSGTIDGRGKGKHGFLKNVPGDGNGRPRNILFISCRNIRVQGITIRNSPVWNQHYLNCEDVMVDGICSWNHCNGNNDGIDIDGCRRFILSNSIIDSDDDGIVLKSTGMAPCENIIIRGCIVSSWANAIKLGTESTGGYKNISISDCIVKPSENASDRIIKSTKSGITAISLEVVDGGVMDGVVVNNIQIEGTECPIYVRLADRARKHTAESPEPRIGTMRNIFISNVYAKNVGNFSSSITGIPNGKIENVTLSNIYISNRGGLVKGSYRTVGDDEGIRHDTNGNLFVDKYWKSAGQVKEDDKGYPQPTVWGNLPCYGLFVRHVKSIRLHNVHFSSEGNEPRKSTIMVDVDNIKNK